jgi:hypothetical protein
LLGAGARTSNAAETPPFSTVAQARAYLQQNPGGQWAQAAFRMIALASMGPLTKGFPQDQLIDGLLLKRAPDTPLTNEQIAELMRLLALGSGPGTVQGFVPPRTSRPLERSY